MASKTAEAPAASKTGPSSEAKKTKCSKFGEAPLLCDTCNLLCSWILFLSLGVTTVAKFGYDTGNYQDALKQVTQSDPSARGQIQSGRYGQGVFPITFMTMTVATLIWITHVIQCAREDDEGDEEE